MEKLCGAAVLILVVLISLADSKTTTDPTASTTSITTTTTTSSDKTTKTKSTTTETTTLSTSSPSSSSDEVVYDEAVIQAAFEDFSINYGKTYTSAVKEEKAYQKFRKSWLKIEKHNKDYTKGKTPFRLKTNSRADFSLEEKQAFMNGLVLTPEEKSIIEAMQSGVTAKKVDDPENVTLPDSLDYRDLGYVTEVVDQGFYCSSCYAFTAQGALEGAIFKKYGRLQKLSDQNIIDCNKHPLSGNWGCYGGWMGSVYRYIMGNRGTEAASTYPLGELQYPCKFRRTRSVAQVKSYEFVVGDEEHLKWALNEYGPLAIGINGNHDEFYYYGSGVLDDYDCSPSINHAMVLVGYGTDYSYRVPKDYWIVKNSWSTDWGEQGYMRIVRGKNFCGLNTYVIRVEVV